MPRYSEPESRASVAWLVAVESAMSQLIMEPIVVQILMQPKVLVV